MTQTSLTDRTRATAAFLDDVLKGLSRVRKTLPCKYFYDERGSKLFERICELDEYYLTRTELDIMRRYAGDMVARIGAGSTLIEYGCGNGLKTRTLLAELADGAHYVPVDISQEHLHATAAQIVREFPHLRVLPVTADFTRPFAIPAEARQGRRIAYFPGSTIGNFGPQAARRLLRSMRRLVGPSGGLLIGVDLPKSAEVLQAAYDDPVGVTRDFNLNLLARINRELGGSFDLDQFEHRAVFNRRRSRVEMHLVSRSDQTVRIDDEAFSFRRGEMIHTENSYKYTLRDFREIAAGAGFRLEHVWLDPREFFSVQYAVPAADE
ncbi:MAG: L-histidine N(alpha)-methyltransferase [Planctomycetes bacterium]|nr:L-histidine N(alpha)-methyltransferase [Planctomycetota bacterium]